MNANPQSEHLDTDVAANHARASANILVWSAAGFLNYRHQARRSNRPTIQTSTTTKAS